MAINKNALIRYKVLDACFRNPGKRYFIGDLIEECEKVLLEIDPTSDGISRRQILADISFMESSEGWQIELTRNRDGKRVFYRYVNPDFSINNMPLNEVEISQLETATKILSQFKGMPHFEWINELIPKLKQGINLDEKFPVIMDFDANQYLKGIEHLGELYNAIFYKKVLLVSYQPFADETPFDITIHPYYLKQYNNRWFLYGFNPFNNKYDWNLALDRILTIRESSNKYKKNTAIDWNEYFEDILGVTKPEEAKVENIILHFYGKTGKYIESKPIHGSQKFKWIDPEILEVSLELMINYEFERFVMSYGETVKVIKPKKFFTLIRNRHRMAGEL